MQSYSNAYIQNLEALSYNYVGMGLILKQKHTYYLIVYSEDDAFRECNKQGHNLKVVASLLAQL